MISLVLKYLKCHWIYSLVLGYFGIAIGLYLLTDIHILIPCLWKSISGSDCPGCGLTRAFIALLRMEWQEAWLENPLIYMLVPLLTVLILRDFIRFREVQSMEG
ncbi:MULTISPECIES: DUF2752 domain-containing protein [Sphingobacterium]|uniref:DUF2752 domain-containing protein n=1 Tax=Sphingobacterium TaxID=28453 RepID=UPI00257D909A|nr:MULTISPECIES: DUF2752 domain-containing protein [Sphingobacterium]